MHGAWGKESSEAAINDQRCALEAGAPPCAEQARNGHLFIGLPGI
jgi:hypothetical protein